MNILVYFNWQLKLPHYSVFIDEVNRLLEESEDNKIVYVSCNKGTLLPCYPNSEEKKTLCVVCRLNNLQGKFLDPTRVQRMFLEFPTKDDSNYVFDYESVEKLKALEYKGLKIGLGALSSFASMTRNANPKFDEATKALLDKMLINQLNLSDYFLNIIENKSFDKIIFFNGRTADTRPLYDICKKLDISFTILEFIRIDNEYRINKFENSLPHDIEYNDDLIRSLWRNEDSNKIQIATQFYESRRGGKLIRDRRAYVKNQTPNLLPETIDTSKRIISIFNSSEDEFLAIGESWDSKRLFSTQNNGIKFILNAYSDNEDTQFVIRMHPNLTGLKFDFVEDLRRMETDYSNLIVVTPESPISTYRLIEISNLVISFGSSVGAEATYMGKASISLGGSFYYYLDVCYLPKSKDELLEILNSKNLVPKPKLNALKYSYYLMKRPYTLNVLKSIQFKVLFWRLTSFDYFKQKRFVSIINILFNKFIRN